MARVAVLSPSRGLLSGPRCEALFSELRGVDFKMYSSDTLPIPDSFNGLSALALADGFEHAWFVEEDVVVPRGTLRAMLDLGADIAAVDYMLKADPATLSHRTVDGRVVWVSLGCTLVKQAVFQKIGRPWFRTDKILEARHPGSASKRWELALVDRKGGNDYGNQDVYFCFRALEAGFTLGVVPQLLAEHVELNEADHRR